MLVRVFGVVVAFLLVSGIADRLPSAEYFNDTPLSRGPQGDQPRQQWLPDAARARADRAAAARHGADLRRSRAAADHGDPAQRDHRPLSSQCRADPRRDARLARRRERTRCARSQHYHVDYLLICPNLSESTIYRVGSAERLLHAAAARQGPRLAEPGPAAGQLALPDVAGGQVKLRCRPSMTNWTASAARMTPSRRVIIASMRWPMQPHQRAGEQQAQQGQQQGERAARRARSGIRSAPRCAPSAA